MGKWGNEEEVRVVGRPSTNAQGPVCYAVMVGG